MGIFNFFTKSKEEKEALDKGLEKTKENFFSNIGRALVGKSIVDDDVLDNLEESLIAADIGVETTLKIIEKLQKRVAQDKYMSIKELDRILKEEIASLFNINEGDKVTDIIPANAPKPYVIMVVGVNGVGKTTTIGKLATKLKDSGRTVLLGAADTFRAAAVDQLLLWGERAGVPVVAKEMNSDPAAVAFEAVQKGYELGVDVVIIDTAGRLHNKIGLMNELSKIRRVMQKVNDKAPHEVLLVLDGSTGQNAIAQATEFTKATEVNALAITKLDGTAKGGVVIGISDLFKIPIKYIGVGERKEDLQLFDKNEFVEALFKGKQLTN